MADLFISYSRADRTRCDAICETLRLEGYSVAIDHLSIETGEPYRARIRQEIDRATVVIVLWSATSTSSKHSFVLDEVDYAVRREKVLLPLIIDATPDGEVLGYGQLQSLRCTWLGDALAAETCDRLLADVKRHVRPVGPSGAAVLEAALQQLGRELDRKLGDAYTVEERIGTGRMTVVFKARHNVLGRQVAIKVAPLAGILLLPGFYTEFRATLEAAKSLSHANILRVHDVQLLETIACTVMDYVHGVPLDEYIARAGGKLPLGLIKDIACEVAEALAYAHSIGVVHCRLGPSNIMITEAGDRALVSDFGMPNVGGTPEANAARALFLDVRYLSPEQCAGDPAWAQSDQYALGATLYEMLTGRPPFLGKSGFAIMKQHCEDLPRPIREFRTDCPAAIEASILRLLRKQPADRYLATRELVHVIRDWPLPEPERNRDRVSASGASIRAAKTALSSFERCLKADSLLLVHFYQHLKEDPTLAPLLEHMNIDRQIEMLRRSVRHLIEYALGDDNALREIERVAKTHRRFVLNERQLRRFVDTLIAVALEFDPHAADPVERELLRSDWNATTEPGLRRFWELACAATAHCA
jgi:serine/threonine protein kinase